MMKRSEVLVVLGVLGMVSCGPVPAFNHDLEAMLPSRESRTEAGKNPVRDAGLDAGIPPTLSFGAPFQEWSARWRLLRCQPVENPTPDWEVVAESFQSGDLAAVQALESRYGLGMLEIFRNGAPASPSVAGLQMTTRLWMRTMVHGSTVAIRVGNTAHTGVFDLLRLVFTMPERERDRWTLELRLGSTNPGFAGRCSASTNCVDLPIGYPSGCP